MPVELPQPVHRLARPAVPEGDEAVVMGGGKEGVLLVAADVVDRGARLTLQGQQLLGPVRSKRQVPDLILPLLFCTCIKIWAEKFSEPGGGDFC